MKQYNIAISRHGKIDTQVVSATPFKEVVALSCFIGKGIDKKTWYVWEFTCGFDFARGATKKEAAENALRVWNEQGPKGFETAIANASKKLVASNLFPVNSYR